MRLTKRLVGLPEERARFSLSHGLVRAETSFFGFQSNIRGLCVFPGMESVLQSDVDSCSPVLSRVTAKYVGLAIRLAMPTTPSPNFFRRDANK